MKKKKIFLAVSLFITTLLFNACQKEGFVSGDAKSRVGLSISSPPKILNGLLCFSSEEEMANYLDYLEKRINDPENSTLEPAEILLKEEQSLGFYSLRKKLQDEFDRLNEVGFKSFEEVPDYLWLQDPLVRSALSPDGAYIIGNNIMYYCNSEISYKIPNLNFSTLDDIKSNPPDRNGSESDLRDYALSHGLVVFYAGTMSVNTNFHKTEVISVDDFDINGGSGCRNFFRSFYAEIFEDGHIYNGPQTIRVEINWGDGSPISTATNSYMAYYFGLPGGIPHTFPGPGTYHIQARYFLGNSTQPFIQPAGIMLFP